MKRQVTNYTFTPVSSTIQFNEFGYDMQLSRLLLIFNQTAGVELHSILNTTPTISKVSENIFQFTIDVSGMSASDVLLIYYDDPKLDGDITMRVDTTSQSGKLFIGYAPVQSSIYESVWQVYRIDTSNFYEKLYADGNVNYDNIWNDRLTLTYQ